MEELQDALKLFARLCNEEPDGWEPGENVDLDAQAAEVIRLAAIAVGMHP